MGPTVIGDVLGTVGCSEPGVVLVGVVAVVHCMGAFLSTQGYVGAAGVCGGVGTEVLWVLPYALGACGEEGVVLMGAAGASERGVEHGCVHCLGWCLASWSSL